MKAFLSRIWAGWKKVAHAMGVFNTYLLLSVLYFLFIPFFSLVRFSDPLSKRLGAASYWRDRKPVPDTLERHRRPF